MFAVKLNSLIHGWCDSYERAIKIWNNSPVPRTAGQKNNWGDTDRPLRDFRSTHLKVRKVGDEVSFVLYGTPVAVWHGPSTKFVDASWDSLSTNNFAERFGDVKVARYRDRLGERTYCCILHNGDYIYPARAKFEKVNGEWKTYKDPTYPEKTYKDPDHYKEVLTRGKPFFDYVRGLCAINDGFFPTKPQTHHFNTPLNLSECDNNNLEYFYAYASGITLCHARSYDTIRKATLHATVRTIKLPYNYPAPRRTRK